jgi:hypothetical protein
MILNIATSAGQNTTVSIDWSGKTWTVESDPAGVWQRIAYSRKGEIQLTAAPSAIWFWDRSASGERQNIVIIRDSPTSEVDPTHKEGLARYYKPKDAVMADTVVKWTLGASASAATAGPATSAELTPVRRRVIDVIVPAAIPCSFPTAYAALLKAAKAAGQDAKTVPQPGKNSLEGKYMLNPYNPYNKSAGTNCYTLPAHVANQLKRPFRFPGTTGLPKEGRKYHAWINAADQKSGPKPGDLYALCTGDLKDENITHVGVIIDPTGNSWKTADMGQPPDGWSGKYNQRPYDPANNTLAGEIHDGKAPRGLYGWIDIDLLVK